MSGISPQGAPPPDARPVPLLPAPRWLGDWRAWLAAAAVMLVPFLLPIPDELRRHPVIGPLGDQLHTVLFFGVTLLLYWKGPLRGRLWVAALVAALTGGGIEFLQIMVGRQAAWRDFVLDLVGVGLAVGFIVWRGGGRRWGQALLIVLLLSIPVQLRDLPFVAAALFEMRDRFPVIADFEGHWDRYAWYDNYGSEIEIGPEERLATKDSTKVNHVLRLVTGPSDKYPGANVKRLPHDWSLYTELVLRVRHRSEGVDKLRFRVRIEDFEGAVSGRWVVDGFTATDSWQTFTMDLVDRTVNLGDRLLDLQDMDALIVFVSQPDRDLVLEIDDIYLR